MASKRISKEYNDCTANPPPGVHVSLSQGSDLHLWHVTLQGPAKTVYAGGQFGIVVSLPADYPFKAPVVTFATRIYHPNITNDSLGNVCLSMLKSDNWKPASKLRSVLEALYQLLVEPQPDDPLEARIADEFRNNHAEYARQAVFYVDKYARKPPTFRAAEAPGAASAASAASAAAAPTVI